MTKEERSKYDRARYFSIKPKRQAQKLAWNIKNKGKLKEYFKQYRSDNREKIALEKNIWFQKTKSTRNAKSREYYKIRDKSVLRAKDSRRRGEETRCLHPQRNDSKIREIYKLCESVSSESGLKHNVDHVIPIFYGGWHHELNLQILPESINKAKRNDPYWIVDGYKCFLDVPIELWPLWMVCETQK